jgi:aquaporin Z
MVLATTTGQHGRSGVALAGMRRAAAELKDAPRFGWHAGVAQPQRGRRGLASVRAAHDCDDRNAMSQDTPATPTPDPLPVNADEVFAEYGIPAEDPAEIVVTTGPGLVARLGAEAFGTFFLVLAGLGVALYAGITGVGGGPLAVALASGIAFLASAIAVGHVSGGHFNPAVTFGAAVAGRTAWRDVLPYWLAQLVGGALASGLLFVAAASLPALAGKERTFFSSVANGFSVHSPIAAQTGGEGFGLLGALLIELVVTAVFVGVILGATDRRSAHQQAPFAMGLTLAVGLLIAIPVTNGALNPARATAAAIFSESWAFTQLWLFWVAPLAGAGIAALVYRAFAPERVRDDLLGEPDIEEIVAAEEHVAETPSS